jgi:hypothetical protein
MKKFLSLLAVASIFTFSACDDSEDVGPAPTVEVDPTTASNIPGAEVTATVTVSAPNGGQTLNILVNGAADASLPPVDIAGEKTFTYDFKYTVPATAVIGANIVVSFQVIDNKNYPSLVTSIVVNVNDPVITLEGNLTTMTLDATKRYLLKSQVFVPSGVTLTIPAGTVIFGEKKTRATLIVRPGGKIEANGTEANPVVFTSSQSAGERDRGDWGGVIILGNAWVNQTNPAVEGISPAVNYGNNTSPSTNANDNSGTLKYVRIEYGGIELTPNNETNSLTMGAVGNGTTIDHVQVSYGGDDGFEWFGGTVGAKYLVSFSTWDDDFDTDFGWSGKVQFALAVRNPFYADQSQSNAFESDNGPNDNDSPAGGGTAGYTQGIFSNVTVYGPRFTQPTNNSTTGATALSGNFQNSMHIRRRSALSIFNSVIVGFPAGFRFDGTPAYLNYVPAAGDPLGVIANNIIVAAPSSTSFKAYDGNASTEANITAYWDAANTPITGVALPPLSTATWTTLGLNENNFFAKYTVASYPANPDFSVTGGTINTGAAFSSFKFTGDTHFDKTVAYRGAFGGTDWTNGWTEFQSLGKAY